MYACLPVCTHVFISLHLSLCVCMCVYMCVYMERDIGRSVVKEKPLVTYPHGHIKSFTQLFLTWHSFDTVSSSCNTACGGGHSAHLQGTSLGFLENGLLVNIC